MSINKLKQTKENKKQEKEMMANVLRLRQEIKDKFFPILLQCKNIEEASLLCQVISGQIHAGYNAMTNKIKVSDLELDRLMKDKDNKKELEVVKMFEGETIKDALMVFEGMTHAINSCIQKELKNRKLEELTELQKDFA